MIRRSLGFLTQRAPREVEMCADAYFRAVGYRRRPDEAGTLVFERGRRLAGFFSARLRDLRTELRLRATPGAVKLDYQVETLGRIVLAEDARFFEVECRDFERFVERGEADVDELLRFEAAARRAALRRLMVMAAIGALLASAAAAASAFIRP